MRPVSDYPIQKIHCLCGTKRRSGKEMNSKNQSPKMEGIFVYFKAE